MPPWAPGSAIHPKVVLGARGSKNLKVPPFLGAVEDVEVVVVVVGLGAVVVEVAT